MIGTTLEININISSVSIPEEHETINTKSSFIKISSYALCKEARGETSKQAKVQGAFTINA